MVAEISGTFYYQYCAVETDSEALASVPVDEFLDEDYTHMSAYGSCCFAFRAAQDSQQIVQCDVARLMPYKSHKLLELLATSRR